MLNFSAHKSIVHIDLDSFFVSVERLKNPGLIGKPVIIGGSSTRGVVASCSYETRQYGVRSAMPSTLARQLCPHALFIKGDMESYSQYSDLVTEIIKDKSPLFEKASIDEFYLDLTGMDRFFGCYKWTSELKKYIIKESGLPLSFCLAINKLISKMGAGEFKPDGSAEIQAGTEKDFIAPLSVQKIPGVGKVTTYQLFGMGIKTIRKLREIPPRYLEKEFGKYGISLYKKANAEDDSPVEPYSEQKSLSTENTFDVDTTDIYYLNTVMIKMTESLAFQLRSMNKLTGCISVKIRYTDFQTTSRQKRIPYASADAGLIETVQELFKALYDRRQLIRLVGVRFSHLVHGNHQIDLFNDTASSISLYQAIDEMKKRFGPEAVTRAICL